MDPRRFWLAALAVCSLGWSSARADETLGYNRLIRPILADNCFACHGPDSASRKADLRLDKREAAVEAGAIVPGNPGESELIARINSDNPDERMPPAASHKQLTSEQRELLARWIAAGAEYQPHWSFIAPVRSPLPAVQDSAWPRNPIDYFVLARLEAEGLKPAAEADRRAIARRVSFDLRGLPPSRPRSRPSSTTRPATPTSVTSIACSTRRPGASIAPATGSTRPAMPTPTASTSTTSARCGRIAIG